MSLPYQHKENKNPSEVNESSASYENAETALLREGLNRSYKERLLFATMLYKVQQSFKKATIISKPDNLTK
ncbi:hypothetical protein [Ferruginibacter sp. HRS2-29]|uniref:hypothetical protein n=1 Tax=Ferruginibacter sp. HRS2-29 TaxID=2487334 RepID=UPI0020CF4646|nr:hypothetical protein [Ferruginibacter sp. HRS2-29]MCP9751637.1 hypothetical protein [Ferruginibacter sp. HRS2-29]